MTDPSEVTTKIKEAFIAGGLPVGLAEDIAYHMTAWRPELEDLIKVLTDPSSFNDQQIRTITMDFLKVVPDHIAAARRLTGSGPTEDIFIHKTDKE